MSAFTSVYKSRTSHITLGKGVYAKKAVITAATEISGTVSSKGNLINSAIVLEVQTPDSKYPSKVWVMGNIEGDQLSGISRHKMSSYVDFVFTFFDANDTNLMSTANPLAIDQANLNALVGVETWIITYISGLYNGKPNYKTLDKFYPVDNNGNGVEFIQEKWEKVVGYLTKKNQYTPEILDIQQPLPAPSNNPDIEEMPNIY